MADTNATNTSRNDAIYTLGNEVAAIAERLFSEVTADETLVKQAEAAVLAGKKEELKASLTSNDDRQRHSNLIDSAETLAELNAIMAEITVQASMTAATTVGFKETAHEDMLERLQERRLQRTLESEQLYNKIADAYAAAGEETPEWLDAYNEKLKEHKAREAELQRMIAEGEDPEKIAAYRQALGEHEIEVGEAEVAVTEQAKREGKATQEDHEGAVGRLGERTASVYMEAAIRAGKSPEEVQRAHDEGLKAGEARAEEIIGASDPIAAVGLTNFESAKTAAFIDSGPISATKENASLDMGGFSGFGAIQIEEANMEKDPASSMLSVPLATDSSQVREV